ncbi:caveolin-2-like [Conger conger]|uniref:caveolin-2-like n=1 Tax=Conger conger TaxID=82655 RepID=UPI002A5A31FB|nr:caveolin-2-like [Conger conger]
MIKEDSQEVTRIDLEEIEEQSEEERSEVRSELQSEIGSQDGGRSSQGTTRPLQQDRDPKGVNQCLKVTFEDVIAEPPSVRSFDKVWLWSHALFEVSRVWFYRLISLLLAVPLALIAGVLFALLSCIHIWLIMPCVQLLLINMHWVQTIWASVLDIAVAPLFSSMGKCCGAITIRVARD